MHQRGKQVARVGFMPFTICKCKTRYMKGARPQFRTDHRTLRDFQLILGREDPVVVLACLVLKARSCMKDNEINMTSCTYSAAFLLRDSQVHYEPYGSLCPSMKCSHCWAAAQQLLNDACMLQNSLKVVFFTSCLQPKWQDTCTWQCGNLVVLKYLPGVSCSFGLLSRILLFLPASPSSCHNFPL